MTESDPGLMVIFMTVYNIQPASMLLGGRF